MHKFRLILLSTLLFSLISAPLYAVEIKNLKAWESSGYIHVQYDLLAKELGESEADVTVVLEIGDKKYPSNKISVTGDSGPKVKVGRAKKFKWHVAKDFPTGFTGEISWDVTAASETDRKKEQMKTDLTGKWRQEILSSGKQVKPADSFYGCNEVNLIEQLGDKITAYCNGNISGQTLRVIFFEGVREGNLTKGKHRYSDKFTLNPFAAICPELEEVTAILDDSATEIRFKIGHYREYNIDKMAGFFSSAETSCNVKPIGNDAEVIYKRVLD